MNCREFTEFVIEWVDGELAADERATFEAHIRECPPCLRFLHSYQDTVRLGKAACADDESLLQEVPERLIQAILAARRR